MGSFYVTTPIYYVNDLPHIGHIYTTVVADTLARYRRLAGDDVRFLTGTDEHGQNIERAAAREGVRPIELADRVVSRYHQWWRELGISHDDFIRTTEPRHFAGVEEIVRRIDAAGDLYTDRHEGWYCSSCENFYTEKELLAGNRCPVHEQPVEWHSEENVFFRLSRYQQPLLDLYENHPEFVRPETRRNEVRSFVASGLRDLSVSRAGLDWGVPFPGRPGQTVYVWLDALTNYISALGFGGGGGARRRRRRRLPPLLGGAGRRAFPPGGQGHPPLPRRLLAGLPAVGGPAAAHHGVGARLVAARPEEDLQVGGQRGAPRSAGGHLRRRRPALFSAPRDDLRPGRQLLRRGLRRPLQLRPRQRPGQHRQPRGHPRPPRLRRQDAAASPATTIR